MTNANSISQTATGTLYLTSASTIINQATANYDFGDGAKLFWNGDNVTPLFTNRGHIQKSTGPGLAEIKVGFLYNDGGDIQVDSGTLALGSTLVDSTTSNTFLLPGAGVLDLTDSTTQATYLGTYNGAADSHALLSSGQLNVASAGAIFNFPNLQWTGGTLLAAGGLINSGTVTLSVSDKVLDGQLTNTGTIIHKAGGTFYLQATGVLTNLGTYDFQDDNSWMWPGLENRTSTFNNQGIVRKSSGTSSGYSRLHVGVFNNNGGSIEALTSTLSLGAARVTSTDASAFAAPGAGVLELTDATETTYSGVFSGSGTVRLSSGYLDVAAGGATFNFSNWQWTGGHLQAPGGLINSGTVTLSVSDKVLDGQLTNTGTIIHKAGGIFYLQAEASILNKESGVYDFREDGAYLFPSGGSTSTFTNYGTIKKSGGSGISYLEPAVFFNRVGTGFTGTVDVQTGTLHVEVAGDNSGVFNLAAGATVDFARGVFELNDGTSFGGQGTVQVSGELLHFNTSVTLPNLTVSGGIARLRSRIDVSQDYQQTGGVLQIDIAGSPASGLVGELAVQGQATLGGVLLINVINPYRPDVGDQFQVMTFGSRVGNFGSMLGLDLGDGLTLDPRFDAGSLTLITMD